MCAEEGVRADENRGGPRERDDADGVSRLRRTRRRRRRRGRCVRAIARRRGGRIPAIRDRDPGRREGRRRVRRVAGSNSVGGGLGLDAAELAVDGEETLEVGEVAPRTARSGVRIPSDASFAGVARSKTRSEATPRMPRPSPVAPGERRRARDEDADAGSDRGERGAFGEASAPRDASAATTASASPPRALCSWSRVRSAEPRRESARTTRGPVPRSASATSGGGSEAEADDRTREPSETSAPRSTSSTGVSPPLGDIPPWLICARDPRARAGVTCGRASGVVTRTARVERPDERSAMHTAPQKGDSSSDENHGCRPTNFVGVGPAGQISYRSL